MHVPTWPASKCPPYSVYNTSVYTHGHGHLALFYRLSVESIIITDLNIQYILLHIILLKQIEFVEEIKLYTLNQINKL